MGFKMTGAKKAPTIFVGVRIPEDWVDQIDRIAKETSTKTEKFNRSDVIREMVRQCLFEGGEKGRGAKEG